MDGEKDGDAARLEASHDIVHANARGIHDLALHESHLSRRAQKRPVPSVIESHGEEFDPALLFYFLDPREEGFASRFHRSLVSPAGQDLHAQLGVSGKSRSVDHHKLIAQGFTGGGCRLYQGGFCDGQNFKAIEDEQ